MAWCCCRWADKITGKVLPTDTPHHAYTLIEPLGVVAAVSAFTATVHRKALQLQVAKSFGGAMMHGIMVLPVTVTCGVR